MWINILTKINLEKSALTHSEISTARIKEIINIIFNKNRNLNDFKNKEFVLYLDFEDENISHRFHYIFENSLEKCKINFLKLKMKILLKVLKYLVLLSKGWIKEAIPVVNKKRSLISGIFLVYLNKIVIFETFCFKKTYLILYLRECYLQIKKQ